MAANTQLPNSARRDARLSNNSVQKVVSNDRYPQQRPSPPRSAMTASRRHQPAGKRKVAVVHRWPGDRREVRRQWPLYAAFQMAEVRRHLAVDRGAAAADRRIDRVTVRVSCVRWNSWKRCALTTENSTRLDAGWGANPFGRHRHRRNDPIWRMPAKSFANALPTGFSPRAAAELEVPQQVGRVPAGSMACGLIK